MKTSLFMNKNLNRATHCQIHKLKDLLWHEFIPMSFYHRSFVDLVSIYFFSLLAISGFKGKNTMSGLLSTSCFHSFPKFGLKYVC